MGWQGAVQNHSSYIVKKIVRLEVPTDAYPNVCSFFPASHEVMISWLLLSIYIFYLLIIPEIYAV
jgi:hypothetical protein